MKKEVAPWIKEYVTDMDELNTELTLVKIENKPRLLGNPKLGYADLFTEDYLDNSTDISQCQKDASQIVSSKKEHRKEKGKNVLLKGHPGKKILIKGGSGMGKTTLVKKVAYDWAKGLFTVVSIVFFVFLKLVRPGDAIENVIIAQNPALQGLGVSKQKIKDILETFGKRTLLILDGLDEHVLGQNKDVCEIVEGRKLLCCNILMTSGAHRTDKIEKYFPTVVRIDGLSKDRTSQLISNSLDDSGKIQAVLDLTSRSFISKDPFCSSPMIILLMCILANHDEIDLMQRQIPIGEIYFRVVRCVLTDRYFRENKEFSPSQFENLLKRLGKLAWKMMQDKQGWYEWSKTDIDQEAFDTEFLSLVGKETTDAIITFSHQTLETFFGAFYFVRALDKEKQIEYSGDLLVLKNPMFLQFVLWFLCDDCKQLFLSFKNRELIYNKLASLCAKNIDLPQLDLMETMNVYPSLKIDLSADVDRGELLVRFISKVLSMCSNIKELYLSDSSQLDYIRHTMPDTLPLLHHIHCEKLFYRSGIEASLPESDTDLSIVVDMERKEAIDKLLSFFDGTNQQLAVYLTPSDMPQVELYTHGCLKKLYILGNESLIPCTVITEADHVIKSCSSLTHLSLMHLDIDTKVIVALSKAVKDRKLPLLSHLSFAGCGEALSGKLPLLFKSEWPSLTDVNLKGCYLDEKDIQTLSHSTAGLDVGRLKIVNSLVLDFDKKSIGQNCTEFWSAVHHLFQSPLANMRSLHIHNVDNINYQSLAGGLNQGNLENLTKLGISMVNDAALQKLEVGEDSGLRKIPELIELTLHKFVSSPKSLHSIAVNVKQCNLQKLDISHSSHISGKLFMLINHSFPSLNSLILSDCGLNSQDLCSLAQAKRKGKLPQLKHLDVSQNYDLIDHLSHLFSSDEKWLELLILNTQQSTLSDKELQTLVQKVQSGCLRSLQELCVSAQSFDCLSSYSNMKWSQLRELHVSCSPVYSHIVRVLKPIAKCVEKKWFPNLRKVYLTFHTSDSSGHVSFNEPNLRFSGNMFYEWPTVLSNVLATPNVDNMEEDSVDKMVDHALDVYSSTGFPPEVLKDPAYREALRSAGKLGAQNAIESQSFDWERLSTIVHEFFDNFMADKENAPTSSAQLPSAKNLPIDLIIEDYMKTLRPFAEDLLETLNHDQLDMSKLTCLKHRLRKSGIFVYVS